MSVYIWVASVRYPGFLLGFVALGSVSFER
jgi:hypothetical protein